MDGNAYQGQASEMSLEDRSMHGDSMVSGLQSEWASGDVMPDGSGGDIVSIVDNGFKKYYNL